MNIFVNPAGQRDNIGDSLLRRPYLDTLRASGLQLHVLTGTDADYNSGLRLHADDVQYTSSRSWLIACLRSSLAGKGAIAFNAGEYVGSDAEHKKSWWQGLLVRTARLRRVPVVITGASVRPGTQPEKTRLRQIAAAAKLVTWRDGITRDQFNLGSTQPDWAFAVGSEDTTSHAKRTRMALALRGDRPMLSAEALADIKAYAERADLELWVVVQVRRDSVMAAQLASALGAKLFAWSPEDNHARQEEAVRSFYQSCRIILSDRIHALIVAATEGSLPIGLATSGPEKLQRTFAHVTRLPIVDRDQISQLANVLVDALAEQRLREDLRKARESLARTSSALIRAVQGDS